MNLSISYLVQVNDNLNRVKCYRDIPLYLHLTIYAFSQTLLAGMA